MSLKDLHANMAALKLKARRTKYGNRKVVKNGETFDSVREYERHLVLLDMQAKGDIERLERQPKYPLVVNGVKVGTYIADWWYWHNRTEEGIAEDSKGFRTPEYRLKIKLARVLYPNVRFYES